MVGDITIIEEAVRLVGEGVSVTFPVRGRSMLPFIIGSRESVVLQKPEKVWVGQVVLALADSADGVGWAGRKNHYVVHRVVAVDGDRVTLMGDGNLAGREYCDIAGIKAVATHVVDAKGRRHDLYSGPRCVAARLWGRLQPVRKWLLLFYRVLEKVKLV